MRVLYFIIIGFCFLAAPIQSSLNHDCCSPQEASFLELLERTANDNKPVSLALAIQLLQEVTKYGLKEHYPVVDSLYFEALTNIDLNSEYPAVANEIERISIVSEDETVKTLSSMLRLKDAEIGRKIAYSWHQLNPNPAFEFNIRLFEHWERINYAREHFTRRLNTVIDTDDRGLIYVKYGEPDIEESGLIQFNDSRVRGWIREFNVSQGVSMNVNMEINDAFLSNLISQYFSRPSYSIWIYKRQNEENLIFIFGDDSDRARYGLRESLDEMLPRNSFRSLNELSRFNVGPSMFLQLMMYDKFSKLDTYFSDAFHELESTLLSPSAVRSPELSISKMSQNRNRLISVKNRAPAQKSDFENSLFQLEIDHKAYSIIDPDGEDRILSFFFLQENTNEIFQLFDSAIRTTITGLSAENGFNLISDSLLIEYDRQNLILSSIHSPFEYLTLAAYHTNSEIIQSTGHNQISINRKPLEINDLPDTDQFRVSDLIIGTSQNGQEFFNNTKLPFDIDSNNTFPFNTNLSFLISLSGLEGLLNNFNYRVNVEIVEERRRFLFFGSRERDRFSYSLTFSSDSNYDYRILQIDSDQLSEGNYTLRVAFEDLQSGQEITRSEDFTLIKSL